MVMEQVEDAQAYGEVDVIVDKAQELKLDAIDEPNQIPNLVAQNQPRVCGKSQHLQSCFDK